jgi:hypothetical protein
MNVGGVPLKVDLGARYADLTTSPFRREDGLWTAGPQAEFTTASFGVSGGGGAGDVIPYARISEPVSGQGEGWRMIGVQMFEPSSRFAFDASIGEVSEPHTGDSAKGEVRMSWRF